MTNDKPVATARPMGSYSARQVALIRNMRNWTERARCKGDARFTEDVDSLHGRARVRKIIELGNICKACPVRVDCLDHAMRMPESTGFWAGYMAADQLPRLRKELR